MDTVQQYELAASQATGDQVYPGAEKQEPTSEGELLGNTDLPERAGQAGERNTTQPGEGNFPIQNKETIKRKRANKTAAKLKQTKLDARREQFLAQVIGAKSVASQQSGVGRKEVETTAGSSDYPGGASGVALGNSATLGTKEGSNGVVSNKEPCKGDKPSEYNRQIPNGFPHKTEESPKADKLRSDEDETVEASTKSRTSFPWGEDACACDERGYGLDDGPQFPTSSRQKKAGDGADRDERTGAREGPLSLSLKLLEGTELAFAAENGNPTRSSVREGAGGKPASKGGKKDKKLVVSKEGVKRTSNSLGERKPALCTQSIDAKGGQKKNGLVNNELVGKDGASYLGIGKTSFPLNGSYQPDSWEEIAADEPSSNGQQSAEGHGEGSEEVPVKVQKGSSHAKCCKGKKETNKRSQKSRVDGGEDIIGNDVSKAQANGKEGIVNTANGDAVRGHGRGNGYASAHAENGKKGGHGNINGHIAAEERAGHSREGSSRASSRASSSWGASASEDEGSGRHESDTEDDWEAAADALTQEAESSRSAHGGHGNGVANGVAEGNDATRKGGVPSVQGADLGRGANNKEAGTGLGAGVAAHTGFRRNGLQHQASFPAVGHRQDYQCEAGTLRPEYKYTTSGLGMRSRSVNGVNGRAWRPDDAARPQTLPPPTVGRPEGSMMQFSTLTSSSEGWQLGVAKRPAWAAPPPAPSFCPICTEELDMTDSSFVPCSCGFRLCLFCHHRIASDDGRCPGCRKAYSSEVASKLSRTPSLWLRV